MIGQVVLIAAVAVSGDPIAVEPRQPTGKWLVDFADAQCVATRNYGTKDEPIFLVLKQPPLGSVMQLAIVDTRGSGAPKQFKATLTFDDQKPIKIGYLRYQPLKSKYRSSLFNVPVTDFAAAVGAKVVRIRGQGINDAFVLSAMPSVLKTMNECALDLQKVWNIEDPGREKDGPIDADGAKGNLTRLFSGDDYPADAIFDMRSGTVRVSMLIDERGRVADCAILETSDTPVLDAQTCAILKERARFKPATGPDGKPVKDGYIQRITWRLE